MINKDYILRLAETLGRELSIILGLRKADKHENALIYIDNLLIQTVGLTSSFINSVSEEMLLQTLSPLGRLNVDKCLWVASLLKAEGDIYGDKGNSNASYYRHLKALNLFLTAQFHEKVLSQSHFFVETEELITSLQDYELPTKTKSTLVAYYELTGRYAKAEDMLFEVLESDDAPEDSKAQAVAFYARLRQKSDADLLAGNMTMDEIEEGMAQVAEKGV